MTAIVSKAVSSDRRFDDILADVAASALLVDRAAASPVDHLSTLAAAGRLDQGIEELLQRADGACDVREAAETIASLAEECLSTAFGVWAHRVVEDYLARGRQSFATQAALTRLRAGEIVGATGMAQGLKHLAGLGEIGIVATVEGEGWRLNGRVLWLSNLVDDAVVVLPAATAFGTLVVWVSLRQPGFRTELVDGLLALDATASGVLEIKDVLAPADQVLSEDFPAFAREFKPTFLVLQSSFAVGVIRRSWREIKALLPAGDGVFQGDVARLGGRITELLGRWERLAANTQGAHIREHLQLRLDVSHLAQAVTRLELTLAGGRGYLEESGANRRFREAAFLPVHSPSEGQLRKELLDS